MRRLQRELGRQFVPVRELPITLGITASQFDALLYQAKIAPAVLSIVAHNFSEELIQSVLYTIQQDPSSIVAIGYFLEISGKSEVGLYQWARDESGKAPGIYLAEKFRMLRQSRSQSIDSGFTDPKLLPFLVGGLDNYLKEKGVSISLDPDTVPDQKEKTIVSELIRDLAISADKKEKELTPDDYITIDAHLAERKLRLGALFTKI